MEHYQFTAEEIKRMGDGQSASITNTEVDALRARVAELESERLRFYHADGTFEVLASPEEVTKSRVACAKLIQDLDREQDEMIAQRDHAEEWADKLAEAIALHFREDIGEHFSANNPWAEALNLIDGTFCR